MQIRHPVFVILPLVDDAHTSEVFDRGIQPALDGCGFDAISVDRNAIQRGISEEIYKRIRQSYFVVADLSHERPNCYYEVGYAHAIGKPVLIICKGGTSIHSNLSHLKHYSFTDGASIIRLLKEKLPSFLETADRVHDDTRNGKFGRKCIRGGYRLSAKIEKCTNKKCLITLEVSTISATACRNGKVKFYMHEWYNKPVQTITLHDGCARYEEVTSNDGPWTVGATIDGTNIRLELDLATIPGAKDWWYRDCFDLA